LNLLAMRSDALCDVVPQNALVLIRPTVIMPSKTRRLG
jgi:hypothetical protein